MFGKKRKKMKNKNARTQHNTTHARMHSKCLLARTLLLACSLLPHAVPHRNAWPRCSLQACLHALLSSCPHE
jgi:hypothetical protein